MSQDHTPGSRAPHKTGPAATSDNRSVHDPAPAGRPSQQAIVDANALVAHAATARSKADDAVVRRMVNAVGNLEHRCRTEVDTSAFWTAWIDAAPAVGPGPGQPLAEPDMGRVVRALGAVGRTDVDDLNAFLSAYMAHEHLPQSVHGAPAPPILLTPEARAMKGLAAICGPRCCDAVAEFWSAYNELSASLAPVTAESLRETRRYEEAGRVNQTSFWLAMLCVVLFVATVLLNADLQRGKQIEKALVENDAAYRKAHEDFKAAFERQCALRARTAGERNGKAGTDGASSQDLQQSRMAISVALHAMGQASSREQMLTHRFSGDWVASVWRSLIHPWQAVQSWAGAPLDLERSRMQEDSGDGSLQTFAASEAVTNDCDGRWLARIRTRSSVTETARPATGFSVILERLLRVGAAPPPSADPSVPSAPSSPTASAPAQAGSGSAQAGSAPPAATPASSPARRPVFVVRLDGLAVLDRIQNVYIPMLMGLIGAIAYMLRSIILDLRAHTYLPRYPSHMVMRGILGMIAGVLGGSWVNLSSGEGLRAMPPLFTPFVLGYGTEVVFNLLDRLVNGLTPTGTRQTGAAPSRPAPTGPEAPPSAG